VIPAVTPALVGNGVDVFAADIVMDATGALRDFNQAGVLLPADIHVATRLARMGPEKDERVALAVALAVRAPRFGNVYVDLATVRATVGDVDEGVDLDALPWPDPDEWAALLAVSPLVAVGEDGPRDRPLRLIGAALYLDRYWRDEQSVAEDLAGRARSCQPVVDEVVLGRGLHRLFQDDTSAEQRWAAAAAVMRRLSVIAGGPGTGKTTTIARVIALLEEQALALGLRPPLVGLAAPTGKAAARMQEAVRAEAQRIEIDDAVRARLVSVGASTLHRLLGVRPESSSRFRHNRNNHLPHDALIVDETSMVSLSLMARLTEATRDDARLILLGDPEQLSSVEAGAVLGDIVGPARTGQKMGLATRVRFERVTGVPLSPAPAASSGAPPGPLAEPAASGVGDGIVVLRATYRFSGPLAELAGAIRSGDGERAVAVLASDQPGIRWLPVDVGEDELALGNSPALAPIRSAVTDAGAALFHAATDGDAGGALAALARFRVLCAHRRGRASVSTWTQRIEEWLAQAVEGFSSARAWYLGRPVIVTANDYGLRLFNGDTGVVVSRGDGAIGVVFHRGGAVVSISPSRLSAVDTVFAMTVHKAQGSEFKQVAVLLPPPSSPILTRQLLYTAVTRAQDGVILAGSEESIRTAISRPVARASGLTRRLWEAEP
jgi:exodeoxyribonuclease V alpha subunit